MTPHILVCGDVIIDRTLHGSVERVNPEAPGKVFRTLYQTDELGGAGAVARLCAGLGCRVTLVAPGPTGDGAWSLPAHLASDVIRHEISWQRDRPAALLTIKQRCSVGGTMLHDRIDFDAMSEQPVDSKLPYLTEPTDFDAILVADYRKGAIGHRTVTLLRALYPETPIIVDPAAGVPWRNYADATIIKANSAEATGSTLDVERYPYVVTIVTDDGNGMYLDGRLIKTERKPAVDPSGCGDTVLAVLGWCVARGLPYEEACRLANRAAGVQVQRRGVQVIRPREFTDVVVATNGCFDGGLHPGHLATLTFAKSQGTKLIVLINDDESVRRLKGHDRPIYSSTHRSSMLRALSCVDEVRVFSEDTPERVLAEIKPDVLVKGSEYEGRELPGSGHAVKTVFAPMIDGYSTSLLMERLMT